MNIYFAAAIRGGRNDAGIYSLLVQELSRYGKVLTEHVGNDALLARERQLSENEIFRRDMQWLDQADLLIAEVSTPSLGVGYELAMAEIRSIPSLCLFRRQEETRLSAMIAGNPFYKTISYKNPIELQALLKDFFSRFGQ